jgi:flagellar basal-body rod protein FlgF
MNIVEAIIASRLTAQQRVTEVTAANLANSNTPGFKAERVQFADWIARQNGAGVVPGGNSIAFTQDRATWREQQPGALTHTANPFDLALSGDGWFTVSTANGVRLTRDGRFGPLPDGTLANSAGNAVLDPNGRPIQLSPTDTRVSIAGDGAISSENGQLGKIGIVKPSDPSQLTAEGGTLFLATGATVPVAAPAIVQGAIEDSNVQPVMEVTRMMNDMRQFQIVVQFLQAESDRQQSAIDKLLPSS